MNVIPIRHGVEAPGDDGHGGTNPLAHAPVAAPSDDWIEAARREFLRRWWAENGDSFEFSRDAYGEKP